MRAAQKIRAAINVFSSETLSAITERSNDSCYLLHNGEIAGGPIPGLPGGSLGVVRTFHQHLQETALRSAYCRAQVSRHMDIKYKY